MRLDQGFAAMSLFIAGLTGCASSNHVTSYVAIEHMSTAKDGYQTIEPYLERAAGETGAVMLVYNADGTILYQASAGPMAVSDPVYVASASKWVVAALVMTLVDEGLLELDAPASQYAPYLTAELSRITLRQMLSHTSGMNSSNLVDARANASLQTFARELAILPLESAPGTTLSYGGVSMQIAGAIMEEVSGQSFQALFLDRLAGPLEMQGAYFCHPLNCDVENPEDVTNPLIGGGLKISAEDFGAFLAMISEGGVYKGRRILSEAALDDLSKVTTVGLARGALPAISEADWEYALGQWCHLNEPGEDCGILQSVGAFGAYPWIDTQRGIYGIFVTESLIPLVIDDIIAMRTLIETAYDDSHPNTLADPYDD
ncbi:serine hydrolase domain-containing protein [Hyphomonas sp.]|uniref:serine hydrolase domain-containing protein n=1 Tax=Hyphomonas sp. TaxID=87 RepID=UPI001BCE7185|nr:serine hydrolase domain-containing protein [Hyphomonas sp.]